MAKAVVALFDNFDDAQRAVQDLVNQGFPRDEISLVANDEGGPNAAPPVSAAAGGAGIGAVLGGLAGLLVGLGALAIPGIGPVIAAGPLAAALAGAGIGAVTGGLIGALVDAGVPEGEARYYAEGVQRGGTLVTVRTADDASDRATTILTSLNPVDIHQRAMQWEDTGWTGTPEHDYGEAACTSDFAHYEPEFRRNYESTYADMGYTFEQYRPAYRYGYDLRANERYADWDWDRLEPQARQDWAQRHPNDDWNQYRDAVHYGWDRGTRSWSGSP